MIFAAFAYFVLNWFAQPYHEIPTVKLSRSPGSPQEKRFKVQSQPFYLNGMHLQYQYIVENAYNEGSSEKKVDVIDKKLVDINHHVVILDLLNERKDLEPTVNLSDIDKEKPHMEDFDDVNFDGYKDIRERCDLCGGSSSSIETIYLFDNRKKQFKVWNADMGVNMEIDKKNRTVKSYYGRLSDGGQFHYKEVKFCSHGIQLYKKSIDCVFVNEKKRIFKIIYKKYAGKRLVTHKTQIIIDKENPDFNNIIESFKN